MKRTFRGLKAGKFGNRLMKIKIQNFVDAMNEGRILAGPDNDYLDFELDGAEADKAEQMQRFGAVLIANPFIGYSTTEAADFYHVFHHLKAVSGVFVEIITYPTNPEEDRKAGRPALAVMAFHTEASFARFEALAVGDHIKPAEPNEENEGTKTGPRDGL